MLNRILCAALASGALVLSGSAAAQELKIALIAGKTGPLEAYAKDTEKGFMLGLEYLTNGTMALNGRKIRVIVKDDQLKPDLGKAMAADPAVHECAVARMWNFALGKEDIVSDLSTVPVEVLQPFIDEFESNGQNLKEVLRSMMKSEDFVSF